MLLVSSQQNLRQNRSGANLHPLSQVGNPVREVRLLALADSAFSRRLALVKYR